MKGPLLYLFSFFSGSAELIQVVISFFSVFVIIFLVFPFREFARAWVAKQLGDTTAEDCGMLTMNPLAHIDPMRALCMSLCCIGWSKPTPISINRCRKVSQNTAAVLVSLTGPLALILLAFLLMVIGKTVYVLSPSQTTAYVMTAVVLAAQICAYLAVLNLIPVPPFDGYYIISGLLPRKAAIWMETNARIINFVVLILLISGALALPLQWLSNLMLRFMDLITTWIMPMPIF